MEKTKEVSFDTRYDDVFRTMLQDCSSLILPVINEVFGQDYGMEEAIDLLQNEVFISLEPNDIQKVITDSNIRVRRNDKRYHIECQSTLDGKMLLRMYQYDSQLAIQTANMENDHLVIRFPESCILYLRATRNTPDILHTTIVAPSGSVTYDVKTMKVKDYSIEAIFEKKLYFLLPFYAFNLEKMIDDFETNKKVIYDSYIKIRKKLNHLIESGELNEYTNKSIVTMIKQVIEKLSGGNESVIKGVDEIMGGKILEYEAKDILRQGIKQGIKQGIDEGRMQQIVEDGLEEGKMQEEILNRLQTKFSLSKEDALAKYNQYATIEA